MSSPKLFPFFGSMQNFGFHCIFTSESFRPIFKNFLVEVFLGWPSIRFLQAMLIAQKLWPPEGSAILPYMAIVKLKKSAPSKVSGWFSTNFVNQIPSSHVDWLKNMAARGQDCFSLHGEFCRNGLIRFHQAMLIGLKIWLPGVWGCKPYIDFSENFKNLLLPNYLADFQVIL